MIDTTRLAGKRILLSGGTTGIGRATLISLAAAGARIVTFGRDDAALKSALEEADGETFGLIADCAARDDVDRVFSTVDEKLGGLDILIANAALGAQPIHEMEEDDWRYVVDTNLVGCLALARRAIKRFESSGSGTLLFVGSIATEIKAVGESVYAATKAGVQAFAETLRKEVADKNIRVGVIQPGSIDTDMQECGDEEKRNAVAQGKMLPSQEVADAILYALSRPATTNVVNLRIEPILQKTS